MQHDQLFIEIDGATADDIYDDLLSLEVELDDELAAMFRLRLALDKEADGAWRYLDDERFTVWKPVTIGAGFVEGGVEELIAGLITHVKPEFDSDPTQCALEIWGMDKSVLMDRVEQIKAWPNKKDSDIAREILQLYGFTPEVEDTDVVHDEAISTIMQRETDMQFLQRLARRNGFVCYIEGETGHFHPVPVDDTPQPVLAIHFGGETNVSRLALDVNALAPVRVAMAQVDRLSKEVLEVLVESGQHALLGAVGADDLLAPGMEPALAVAGPDPVTGNPEMTGICQALSDLAAWYVTGEGEVMANQYGHVLRPRRMVTVKGTGETYSGVYVVTHVTHRLTRDGYVQRFRIKRNALGVGGAEAFAAASPDLGGLF